MLLHGVGLRVLTMSYLSPGIMIGRDRYHEITTVSGLTPPIGEGLWKNVHSCLLMVIICSQRKLVSQKAVVNRYMGEMLAWVPRCLPPDILVVC